MRSPCIGVCKNNGGICSGCHRTVNEIIGWASYSDEQRSLIMAALNGENTTHQCPQCHSNAQCDISAGKETCWCFELDKRSTEDLPADIKQANLCLCRSCLEQHNH
ncbi:cysteine-rich CWC family protein [Vibrio sp. 10N.286.49.B3]|uniref:cysteine-rich CWC family protein n=1 Tax=Vibrio sp. 10N.286.49.B3 TaxID=1880855 RepID=UPI000C85C45D|nr:cysteine-rich CWC family protein [Vibrio sp. 10N.286.49.B3]